jgi:hypothetical protein
MGSRCLFVVSHSKLSLFSPLVSGRCGSHYTKHGSHTITSPIIAFVFPGTYDERLLPAGLFFFQPETTSSACSSGRGSLLSITCCSSSAWRCAVRSTPFISDAFLRTSGCRKNRPTLIDHRAGANRQRKLVLRPVAVEKLRPNQSF